MPSKRRAIVWFRQDLRLHDNEALVEALHVAYEVCPVYVFDERLFKGKTHYGLPKIGIHRVQFIIEAVNDLRRSLKRLGSDLIVRVGKPEEEVYQVAQQLRSSWIFCNRERTPEEVDVQDRLEKKLWSVGQELRYVRGKMLYHTGDLPFPIQHTPDTFTQFKKEVERYVSIRSPYEKPTRRFNFLTVDLELGEIPTLQDFGYLEKPNDRRASYHFEGGEREGLARLNAYLWDSESINSFKTTRDDILGDRISTKFSPWLAQGCLSPKQIYAELKSFEEKNGKSKSTYTLFLSLMYRDFLRFLVKKHGNCVFETGGLRRTEVIQLEDKWEAFERWMMGDTGHSFVDAIMNELNSTGYIHNRARQVAASYLVHDIGVNWQMGAEYFESMLIDYDVCSNWVNWNNVTGIGTDTKDYRPLNIENEVKKLDPNGEYRMIWGDNQANNGISPAVPGGIFSPSRQAEGSFE